MESLVLFLALGADTYKHRYRQLLSRKGTSRAHIKGKDMMDDMMLRDSGLGISRMQGRGNVSSVLFAWDIAETRPDTVSVLQGHSAQSLYERIQRELSFQ